MASPTGGRREGSLEAPTRHPIAWKDPTYWDSDALFKELERVYDICHGCRRCVSLCNAFPTLFDLVDESETMEVDGVAKDDYWSVVDHCYLCDLCYMTKCPYVPPHEWNVDFPHLMLRAKAVKRKDNGVSARDRILSSTDAVGKLASIPVVAQTVNAVNRNAGARKLMERAIGVHHDAPLPAYHSATLQRRAKRRQAPELAPKASDRTTGRVALFATCYGNYNRPDLGEDLIAVFEHNGVPVSLVENTRCCGMPKLELGDLDAVAAAMEHNIPMLAVLVEEGYDIVAPIPSCVLMFKQELPLMFPDDERVRKVRSAMFDPFEYLALRNRAGLLSTEFATSLGRVAYHAPCHQRVQNIGPKTREVLSLVPDTEVTAIERCSGHDGTYAVKTEFHDASVKIGRPVSNRVAKLEVDHFGSDCPMAGEQIAHGLSGPAQAEHPLGLLRKAYGI